MTAIFWQGLMGLAVLLVLGVVLALVAVLVPRLLDFLESSPGAGRLRLADVELPLEQRFPDALPAGAAPGEEPLVAAAIALALAFYQGPGHPVPPVQSRPESTNPWSLAGRWQAMQARRHLPKR